MNPRKYLRTVFLCVSIILICAVAVGGIARQNNDPKLNNFYDVKVSTEDKAINITYNPPKHTDRVEISFVSDTFTHTEKLSPKTRSLSFTDGTHGTKYELHFTAFSKSGNVIGEYSTTADFIDYSVVSAIPMISINTVTGEDPYYEVLDSDPEKKQLGRTVINNEYLNAKFRFIDGGNVYGNYQMKIRVRGNTSALADKTPYKIEFDKPVDLMSNGEPKQEWVLLSDHVYNSFIAQAIGKFCGVEWIPQMRFVNLNLNGKYRGTYLLCEAVAQANRPDLVGKNGFIVQYNPYYWTKEGISFKTEMQISKHMEYTFKYPKIKNIKDNRFTLIKNHFSLVEAALLTDHPYFSEAFDIDSLISWMMSMDILGNYDGAGNNMYFYISNFNSVEPDSAKIKMGPLWDFTMICLTESDSWAKYSANNLIFSEFRNKTGFIELYKSRWDKVSLSLQDIINNEFSYLKNLAETDLKPSIELEAKLINDTYLGTLDSLVETDTQWFEKHINWMDEQINKGNLSVK